MAWLGCLSVGALFIKGSRTNNNAYSLGQKQGDLYTSKLYFDEVERWGECIVCKSIVPGLFFFRGEG